MKLNNRFRHESLQDRTTIRELLEAISKGIGSGKVTLEDESNVLSMRPADLLHLKVTGSVDDGRHKLDIRIMWHTETEIAKGRHLKVK